MLRYDADGGQETTLSIGVALAKFKNFIHNSIYIKLLVL